MDFFLPIAAKSFLIAAAALLLLRLTDKRSASQRSWIAHLGLAAALLLPVAAIALPPLPVQGPAFLASPAAEPAAASPAGEPATAGSDGAPIFDKETAAPAASFPDGGVVAIARSLDWAFWLYAVPAALLLLFTLIALARLITLRARANVLVEPHWLAALAHAQRRMGFKHGTALLTSDELPSPISWGVMRPVILLNSEAAQSHKEAEAIIAHELAHVASLDWAKLLLSRLTVALFWFNPLIWVLAREAHQLREEAADDAVLRADIEDTDYANLLVGVARHECRGLLIGAHGVAPGRNSLSRRVRRVLDSTSARGPVGRAFALGMFAGAAMLAAPLAALTVSAKQAEAPPSPAAQLAAVGEAPTPYYSGAAEAAAPAPTGLTGTVNEAIATAVSATGAVHPVTGWSDEREREVEHKLANAKEALRKARMSGADSRAINAAVASAIAVSRDASKFGRDDGGSVHGVTPRFAAEIRASSRRLARASDGDLAAFAIHGVSPAFVRDLESSGLRGLSPNQLTAAAIHGVNGRFVRSMAAVGYPRLSLNDAVNMRIHGVTADFVQSLQRRGIRPANAAEVTKYRLLGVDHPAFNPNFNIDVDIDGDDDS